MKTPRTALLLLALAGCGSAATSGAGVAPGSSSGASSGPGSDSGSGVTEARSRLPRDTSATAPLGDVAAVVAGNNAFALELHRRLAAPGGNVVTSPYSISTALAMLWPGARGATASQLASALRFTLPEARFHRAFNALDLTLRAPYPWCEPAPAQFTLRIANAAWMQKDHPFVPAYLDVLGVNYGAGVSLLDFEGDPEAARGKIDDAVARATEGRLRDLLPPGSVDEDTKFVLTNAVYFNGGWMPEFDPALTVSGSFRLLDGSDVTAPFMHGRRETHGTVQPAYDAVKLYYRCAPFAMTLIAPKAGTFAAFEGALDVAALAGVDAAMAEATVTLSMPRFSFRWGTKSLREALEALGMTDAFQEGPADLTGLSAPGGLFVSDVLHQTFVAVDEKGTEAAAATAVVGSTSSGGGRLAPPDLTVSLDRPFLFLIRNTSTGQIVFLGRVVDPR